MHLLMLGSYRLRGASIRHDLRDVTIDAESFNLCDADITMWLYHFFRDSLIDVE